MTPTTQQQNIHQVMQLKKGLRMCTDIYPRKTYKWLTGYVWCSLSLIIMEMQVRIKCDVTWTCQGGYCPSKRNSKGQVVVWMWGNWRTRTLFVGIQNGEAVMNNRIEVSSKNRKLNYRQFHFWDFI